jgi:hypothetical protein
MRAKSSAPYRQGTRYGRAAAQALLKAAMGRGASNLTATVGKPMVADSAK